MALESGNILVFWGDNKVLTVKQELADRAIQLKNLDTLLEQSVLLL